MNCPNSLKNDWWADLYRRAYAGTQDLLEGLYQKADRVRLGRLGGGEVFQAVFLNVCLCVPYVVFDRYRCRIVYLIQKVLDLGEAHLPDLSGSIHLSRLYPIAHAVFLISLFVPRSKLPVVLACAVLGFGIAGRLFDPLTGVVLFLFLSGVYAIIKGQWGGRPWKLAAIVVVYILFMNACQLLGDLPDGAAWPLSDEPALVGISRFAPGFIPMLWYVCYDVGAGKLRYVTHNYYLFCRLFLAPVFPAKDMFIAWDERRHWQWRGLFTLGTALVALGLGRFLRKYLEAHDPAWHLSSGPKLIWYSYCNYLSLCFGLVARFNMFVGWARMFGVPIKNAFNFWLLARTPNERWQRWNILFREWIITYVFYPMMRAKRGLFISIMATLLMSGVIHFVGYLTPDRLDPSKAARTLFYWVVNGLAIYVVIVFPRKFPDIMDRLRVRESVLWSLFGILVTWSLYSTLFVLRDKCMTPAEMWSYFQRLV